jgi:UDP-GlcNAc:undecaprenyl-phosphate GlcNAc-1-phosphate transferase
MGFMEYPNARRIHKEPKPLAGVALFAGFWLIIGALSSWTPKMWGILIGSAVVMITGLIDDKNGLKPFPKFLGQLVGSLIVVLSGVRIEFITNPFGGMLYLAYWSLPLTLLWLITITNVVNFIDGLDGLAAGISGIASFPLCIIALQMGQPHIALMAAALGGVTIGFLPFNFHPARLFMGDSGALFLGFMLGVISIEGTLKGVTFIALAIPSILFALLLLDCAFAIWRRIAAGQPFYMADKQHVHHKLLERGYSQKQVALIIYVLSLFLAAASLVSLKLTERQVLFFAALVYTLVILGAGYLGLHRFSQPSSSAGERKL